VTPYYDDGTCVIYHGDCREIIDGIHIHSASHSVVTDPPYGIAFEGYNHGTVTGDESDEMAEWLLHWIDSWGDMTAIVFGVNHFSQYVGEPGRWIVWDKRCDESADRMFDAPFELAWINGDDAPGRIYRIQHGGVVNADGAGVKRVHPTQKPVTLMSRIIRDWAPEGTILDPFMGSGTTLVAAKSLSRRAIGIEIEERYCEIAAKRLAQEVLDFGGAA
jgi:DNA modification methylase